MLIWTVTATWRGKDAGFDGGSIGYCRCSRRFEPHESDWTIPRFQVKIWQVRGMSMIKGGKTE